MYEEETFSCLFSEYAPGILRYLCKRGLPPADAEDLTQEIFLYTYKRINCFDESKATFASWIYLITKSRLKNWYRDNAAMKGIECHVEKELMIPDTGPTPEQAVELSESREQMANALMQLDTLSRSVVLQKYIYGLSAKQIALLHRLHEGHVRVILFRALRKLKLAITKTEGD